MNKENKEVKNNDNNVVFKICISVTKKDYQLQLTTKRAWIVGVVMLVMRFLPKIFQEASF